MDNEQLHEVTFMGSVHRNSSVTPKNPLQWHGDHFRAQAQRLKVEMTQHLYCN